MWSVKLCKSITILAAAVCAFSGIFPQKNAAAQEQKAAPVIAGISASLVAKKPFSTLSRTTRRWWKDSQGNFHFSPGRKWVPVARGNSQKRAQELELNSVKAVRKLLRSVPKRRLLDAAGKEMPTRLLWPVVKGTWGRGFGYTRVVRPDMHHNGIDIGAPTGAPVRAAAAGMVIYSDNTITGYGNCVIILHPNGWITTYAHNLRNTVQTGYRVERGERIALIGSTGASWGPHLHFELRRWGRLIDPAPYIYGNRSVELNGPLIDLNKLDNPNKSKKIIKSRNTASKAVKSRTIQTIKRSRSIAK